MKPKVKVKGLRIGLGVAKNQVAENHTNLSIYSFTHWMLSVSAAQRLRSLE